MEIKKFIKSFLSHLKSLFLSGLFTILPIILTVFILTFTYEFIYKWLTPLHKIEPLIFKKIPGSEFIIVTILILFIGFLLKLVFVTPIIHKFEKIIKKIPFIRSIYSSSKTVVDFFNVSDIASRRRKVILVEFIDKLKMIYM